MAALTPQYEQVRKSIERVEVVRNERIAPEVYLLVLRAPQIAPLIKPGQFVHLLIDNALTLRRPFSIAQVKGDQIFIMYAVLGKGTRILTTKQPGDTSMDIIGPCGNSWPLPEPGTKSLLIGGGLGAAPLGMLAHVLTKSGRAFNFLQAARNEALLIGRAEHAGMNRPISFATDDGSLGHHGLIADLVKEALESDQYDTAYICGPEIMQRFVSEVCLEHGVSTYISLERLMACGIGACLSCNIETASGPRKVCVDGPIFNALDVEFDSLARSSVH